MTTDEGPRPPWTNLHIFADEVQIIDPTLLAFRARIAELRAIRCDVTANIMRDELLSQLETWLDPDTARLRARAFPQIEARKAVLFRIGRPEEI